MVDSYPWGQCTWYVASRFPAIYGYMGNAKAWIASAYKEGYPVSSTPLPDSVVVYRPGGQYSSDGHVAVVDSVNGDGSFNVSEMNFGGFGQVDQRRSTMTNVLGFIIPPGSSASASSVQFTKGSPYSPAPNGANPGASTAPCITKWNIPLTDGICMDGIVGGAAMAAGGFIMLGASMMLIALAMHSTGAGKVAGRAVAGVSGPAGAVVAAHHAQQDRQQQAAKANQKTQQEAAAQSHTEAMRRAQVRTARARARGAEAQAKNPQLRKVA